MRFLHTSDWHLGRRFHEADLIDAQRAFLAHVHDTARDHAVDVILVAGDIYDRAIPSLDAVRLFDSALSQLADLGIPIIMISGNHDSAHRLGVGASVLARAGVHLRTDPATTGTCPVLLDDEHGTVAVYGIPYLEPSLTHDDLEANKSHQAVTTAALDRIRADLATYPEGTRSVVLAHAFVAGGEPSTSERDITVGGLDYVLGSAFTRIDYVALGHLHGAQNVNDHIHYSGSPLAYSFSEAHHTKSLTIVDMAGDGTVTLTRVPTPVPRPLALLKGALEDLLTDPAHEALADHWLQVTLTDPALPYEPMARLRRRFPHTLSLLHERPDNPQQAADRPTYTQRLQGRSDLDIVHDFIKKVRGDDPTPAEQALLRQAVEATQHATHEETV
ncbi:exonuclease SbcCD subunit D [Streptomyces sp. BHT-5-2]|uniref:exonuclease SbcCD subunit D n=1 Tax=Streptomyces sp. BHT-5-2 TaxID=2866715 RepID=UPI001C8E4F1F|nr:exonuclease SbcCD subunit D [Streptomyces sp. BHT-5-2]QZL04189.1 exonuclease SbcCD subunit D [Streptomyces sp. BHT-5-2]